jgi:HTH-type transcriptional regulator/antitoxin HigA
MDQRGLKQSDLLPVFGSRGIASKFLSGKREPDKAHIRKLAESLARRPICFCKA